MTTTEDSPTTTAHAESLGLTISSAQSRAPQYHHIRKDGRQIAVARLTKSGTFLWGWVENQKGRQDFDKIKPFQKALAAEAQR